MDPVPRDPNMLEDYRFEEINAGQGPETKLIREIREVRTWADRSLSMRQAGYRLLRHLQDLLVGLQSGDPELCAQAAREYRHYCEDGHNLYYWGAQTEAGDSPEGNGNYDDEDWHFSEEGEELEVECENEEGEKWMERPESPNGRFRRYTQSGQDEVSDPEEWINIHFPEDREWLATNDAEEKHDDGSGEAAEEAPMLVARPSPTEVDGFDYERDT